MTPIKYLHTPLPQSTTQHTQAYWPGGRGGMPARRYQTTHNAIQRTPTHHWRHSGHAHHAGRRAPAAHEHAGWRHAHTRRRPLLHALHALRMAGRQAMVLRHAGRALLHALWGRHSRSHAWGHPRRRHAGSYSDVTASGVVRQVPPGRGMPGGIPIGGRIPGGIPGGRPGSI